MDPVPDLLILTLPVVIYSMTQPFKNTRDCTCISHGTATCCVAPLTTWLLFFHPNLFQLLGNRSSLQEVACIHLYSQNSSAVTHDVTYKRCTWTTLNLKVPIFKNSVEHKCCYKLVRYWSEHELVFLNKYDVRLFGMQNCFISAMKNVFVRLDFLTAVIMKTVLWDMTPCSLANKYLRFRNGDGILKHLK